MLGLLLGLLCSVHREPMHPGLSWLCVGIYAACIRHELHGLALRSCRAAH